MNALKSLLLSSPLPRSSTSRHASVCMCKCMQWSQRVGSLCTRSERPAPVINGVLVWGTTRRRTQSLGQTTAPPGLSFTWGEENGGKEGGWREKIFPRCPLLSPSLCPSILLFPPKTIDSNNYSHLFPPSLPSSTSPFPLAPVLCSTPTVACPHVLSHVQAQCDNKCKKERGDVL